MIQHVNYNQESGKEKIPGSYSGWWKLNLKKKKSEKEIMRNEKAFYLERKKNECLERKMRKHAS